MGPLPSYDLAAITERLHRVDAGAHHEAELPRAAVAVLLRAPTVRDEAEVFFIERAVRAGDPWSGHMAFPGGRRDPGDVDLRATAVRETREEVGIDLERDATLIARLPDLPAVLKTAEERGMRAFGKDGDMSAFAPKAHLGSAVIDWTPYYTKVVTDTLGGQWQSGNFWWGVKEGAIDLLKIADDEFLTGIIFYVAGVEGKVPGTEGK
jgi:hypothetical protein